MKRIVILLLLIAPFHQFAQTKGAIPTNFDRESSSKHFMLFWNEGETLDDEIDKAKQHAEEVFSKLSEILGPTRMPEDKLIITFEGEGVDPDTYKKSAPNVDNQGRMHLYRFDAGGYLGAMAHEMVHAIRFGTLSNWNRFLEEGLASALATYLYPEMNSFPRYGYSSDLVAGGWLTSSGYYIPLGTLFDQHNRLNLKCSFQSYVLREDFFGYLISKYGLKKLIGFAYTGEVGEKRYYEKIWGKSFYALTKAWEADLRGRFNSIPNSETLIDDYLKKTPAQYMGACKAGEDF